MGNVSGLTAHEVYSSMNLEVGDRFITILPHSEVCIHMQVAGQFMVCELLSNGMVQLYSAKNVDRLYRKFSFPITSGEAGVYGSGTERDPYYVYGGILQSETDEQIAADTQAEIERDRK